MVRGVHRRCTSYGPKQKVTVYERGVGFQIEIFCSEVFQSQPSCVLWFAALRSLTCVCCGSTALNSSCMHAHHFVRGFPQCHGTHRCELVFYFVKSFGRGKIFWGKQKVYGSEVCDVSVHSVPSEGACVFFVLSRHPQPLHKKKPTQKTQQQHTQTQCRSDTQTAGRMRTHEREDSFLQTRS